MHSIAWWPTLIVLVLVSITDLRSRTIPNWVVLPFLVAGLGASAWVHGWGGIRQSLAGATLALVICGAFFWLGGLGAGDVKLCAAIGAWIGPQQLFIAQVVTGIVGGIWVLVWALYAGFAAELFQGTGDLAFGWVKRGKLRDPDMTIDNPLRRKMPYAPAIAIGTLLSFFAF
jgi:prepilin peptidase CpaA